MNPHDPRQKDDIHRWQSNLKGEWEASALYRALANAEKDPVKANVFRKLAEVEDRHAARWEGFLRASGAPCLLYTSPSPRDRQKSRMPSSA